MKYKIWSCFLSLWLFVFCCYAGEPLNVSVKSKAAILMNAKTGRVLYAKNAYMPLPPASTTKVATALFILSQYGDSLQEKVVAKGDCLKMVAPDLLERSGYTLPPYQLISDGSSINLKTGEVLSVYDLLQGMMIRSGNDAANVLAAHFSPTINDFVEQMNAYLAEIGCVNTQFMNPHGIHHPQHKTTAYDLAVMTAVAMEFPVFRKIVRSPAFTRPQTNKQSAAVLSQTNQLLRSSSPYYYPKAIGVKTGYMSQAGYNLVSAAAEEDRELIAVVLGAGKEERYQDTLAMFQAAFKEKKNYQELLPAGPLNLCHSVKGGQSPLTPMTQEAVVVAYFPSEEPSYEAKIEWEDLIAPIQQGQQIGQVVLESDDASFHQTIPLYAYEEVKPTLSFACLLFAKQHSVALSIGALLGVGLIGWAKRRR